MDTVAAIRAACTQPKNYNGLVALILIPYYGEQGIGAAGGAVLGAATAGGDDAIFSGSGVGSVTGAAGLSPSRRSFLSSSE